MGMGVVWSLGGIAILQKPASGSEKTQNPPKPTITPDNPLANFKDHREQMFKPGEKFDLMLKKMREKTKDIPNLDGVQPGGFGPAKITND